MEKIDMQIDEFMNYCQSKNLSRKTLMSYEQTLRLFARYLLDTVKVIDATKLTEKMFREYIVSLKERGKYSVVAEEKSKKTNNPQNRKDLGKKISVSTINNYTRNIKVFYAFLLEQSFIKKNPLTNIKSIKCDRKPKEFIEDMEIIKLLKSMDNSKFHEYRDSIIIQTLLDTGTRISETLSILVQDLDLANRSILLQAENTKGSKHRYVYFSQELQKELRRWLQYKDRYVESNYLFPSVKCNKLQIGSFETNLRQYGQRIGINIHPHQLRNNFAKRFLMAGGNLFTLSKILGHSDISITTNSYLDLSDDDIRKSYQAFSPLANMRKAGK
ncbi:MULTISPECIES: tyrosine-type recombinase/integrase [Clostridium]|uniref:Tyrosine-type recombinase/integrase n=1 Tax=Clostridium frigoriphilum TaxID=443253 RepID=A0ABU7UUE6_9CLOT|nr:tyrosine-type recombinase/integrase [Clostridium sp. DSM 17811]MBU3098711.1 tyrosine-type recombinase/integrase [Clostridium sp. DSM 17811]